MSDPTRRSFLRHTAAAALGAPAMAAIASAADLEKINTLNARKLFRL
jgi:hypothetical protein